MEGTAWEGFARHTVIFLDNDRIERGILEGHGPALAAVEDDLLRGRLLHLEAGRRLHLRDGKLAGVEALALLMELDLTISVGEDLTEVEGFRRALGLAR